MTNLFYIKDLENLAITTEASFFKDTKDTIRIVYNVNGVDYTEIYFGSEKNGFRKYYK